MGARAPRSGSRHEAKRASYSVRFAPSGPAGIDPGTIFLTNLDRMAPGTVEGDRTFAVWADYTASLDAQPEAFARMQTIQPCADFEGACAELNRDPAIFFTSLTPNEVMDTAGASTRCE